VYNLCIENSAIFIQSDESESNAYMSHQICWWRWTWTMEITWDVSAVTTKWTYQTLTLLWW